MHILARRIVGQFASPRVRVITQTAFTSSRLLKSNLRFSSKMAAPVESPTIFDRILRKEVSPRSFERAAANLSFMQSLAHPRFRQQWYMKMI